MLLWLINIDFAGGSAIAGLDIGDTSVLFLKPRKSVNVLQQVKTVSIQQPRKSVKTL